MFYHTCLKKDQGFVLQAFPRCLFNTQDKKRSVKLTTHA